jgi:hypothetical protein
VGKWSRLGIHFSTGFFLFASFSFGAYDGRMSECGGWPAAKRGSRSMEGMEANWLRREILFEGAGKQGVQNIQYLNNLKLSVLVQ